MVLSVPAHAYDSGLFTFSYIHICVCWISPAVTVGSSGLRIIKKGGVELIIPKPLLIKNYSSKAFNKLLRE